MFLTPWCYGLAAFLLCQAVVAAYQFAQAAVGTAFGIRLREVSVGVGPTLFRRTFGAWRFRLGALPLGGYTTFKGQDDADASGWETAAGRFQDAAALGQMLTVLSGPLVPLILGLVLLGLPVWASAPQLAVTLPDGSIVRPCAVGGLTLRDEPSTAEGQWRLFRETFIEFALRTVTFRSLEGWGGYVGFFVTCGTAGAVSTWAWLTSLGVVFMGLGLVNLLPIPTLNGFLLVIALCRAFGRPLPDGPRLQLTYLGLLVVLVVCVRVWWIDLRWLWEVVCP
jgi:membrane-associated protease RseP (regulator of RpoE activity)